MLNWLKKIFWVTFPKSESEPEKYRERYSDLFETYRVILFYDTEDHYKYHIEKLTLAIETDPKNPFLFNNRGLTFSEIGDERAIPDFKRSIEISEHWIPYRNLADLYRRGKMIDEELSAISRAIEINPKEVTILRYRASLFERQNNFDRAIDDISRAILLDPDFAYSYLERSKYYLNIGNHEMSEMDRMRYETLKSESNPS